MPSVKLNHLAVILDGNGRWAKRQNKPRTYGHNVGFNKIEELCNWAIEAEIPYLSLFCFSTENWKRDKNEVNFLFKLIDKFYKKYSNLSNEKKIKVVWIGRRDHVSNAVQTSLEKLEATSDFAEPKLVLNLCIDYGSLEELRFTIAKIIGEFKDEANFLANFQEKDIFKYMYTKQSPPVDFLIRPGGELRISNFLLLQIYYAELYFCTKYWPEFEKTDFVTAINNYYNRKRRFGDINNNE